MILDYINPIKIYKSLVDNLDDLAMCAKYKKIVHELNKEGKLEELGLSMDRDANIYIGINLNPELLLYSDTSQTSVELKLIGEKIKKYTDFLTKEGILDSVIMNYDRVHTEEYYGYVLQITYNFKKYRRFDLIYAISYFSTILLIISALVALIV